MASQRRHIALILNVNKAYDRKVVSGVSRYMREVGNWSLYLENDPLCKIPDFESWDGDGIIADLDDPDVYKAVKNLSIPVVGFGGGYGAYRKEESIPYVYTNNHHIAELAASHLLERGFRRFAYCGLPATPINGWSHERSLKFNEIITSHGFQCSHYSGRSDSPKKWQMVIQGLTDWLKTLELPIGLMVANDSRARHVLEACSQLGIRVPEDLAVIGVDNDEMMCELATPPLTSIIQGTDKLGYETARILDSMIDGEQVAIKSRIEPLGVEVRQSTDVIAIEDPLVSQALHFIRGHACNCIRVEEVASHCNFSLPPIEKNSKQLMVRPVHSEICRIQLQKAKELLTHTEMPLKKVSQVAGFSTVQYMNAKLKIATGLTPLQYRNHKR